MQSCALRIPTHVRPSFWFCEEKCACPSLNTVAAIRCVTCSIYQCQSCFTQTHQKQRHDYRPIPLIPPSLLCEGQQCKKNLPSPNFADIVCFDCCEQRFCLDCEQAVHKGPLAQHQKRISFAEYQQNKLQSVKLKQQHHITKESNKPTSPSCDSEDERLDFHSFPLESQKFIEGFSQSPISEPDFFQSFAVYSQRIVDSWESTGNLDSDQFQESDSSEGDTMNGTNNQSPRVPRPRNRQGQSTTPSKSSPLSVAPNSDGVKPKAVQLMNESEEVLIKSAEELSELLGCDSEKEFNVISIIGNTGDGKSHTMNHTFFNEVEVFEVSDSPNPCTIGVHVAVSDSFLLLDTEGLLGKTHKNNQRTRMLLKILALSDVAIYRTKAERMHSDLFDFLRDANVAYKDFMYPALKELITSKPSSPASPSNARDRRDSHIPSELVHCLGPSIIIFHETQHVKPLGPQEWRDEWRRQICPENEANCIFSRVEYLPAFGNVDKAVTIDKRYENLRRMVRDAIASKDSFRHPRTLSVFMEHFNQLNIRYGGEMEDIPKLTFPEQYFTCPMTCKVCQWRCKYTLNHQGPHEAKNGPDCKPSNMIDNKIYFCKDCWNVRHERKRAFWAPAPRNSNILSATFSYLWYGSTLQCEACNTLAYFREQWLSPTDPELSNKVIVAYDHIFDGDRGGRQDTCHALQRVFDNFNALSSHVGVVKDTLTDYAKPDYWQPNDEITNCVVCNKDFAELGLKKHHCRKCGRGVCDPCSRDRRPVDEHGYVQPVRVCDKCVHKQDNPEEYQKQHQLSLPTQPSATNSVTARKAVEITSDTLGILGRVAQIPAGLAKEYARPSYWQPDHECITCHNCDTDFAKKGISLHHCRSCGYGVCGKCSKRQCTVPQRGYHDSPVRVCDKCYTMLAEKSNQSSSSSAPSRS